MHEPPEDMETEDLFVRLRRATMAAPVSSSEEEVEEEGEEYDLHVRLLRATAGTPAPESTQYIPRPRSRSDEEAGDEPSAAVDAGSGDLFSRLRRATMSAPASSDEEGNDSEAAVPFGHAPLPLGLDGGAQDASLAPQLNRDSCYCI